MKVRKVSATQFRCNFCLDWHSSKSAVLPPSSFNICEQCFVKARGTSSFKVVHPTDLEVYEVRLRKTGLVGDEARSVNTQFLGELLDFYEKTADKGRINVLRNYLTDCEALETNLFRNNEPFVDFVNQIYKFELGRVESIWENVLKQITDASKMIDTQRNTITSSLESYQYDINQDPAKIFNTQVYRDKIEKMREEADKILKTQLESIKEMYVENPERFFMEGFDIRREKMQTEPIEPTTMFQIPGEDHIMSSKNSLVPCNQPDLKKVSSYKSKRDYKSTKRDLKGTNQFNSDKENSFLETPISIKKFPKSVSKPIKQVYLSSRNFNLDLESVRTPQAKLKQENVSPVQDPLILYDDFDFKNLRQWPREQITELLNRRGHLPKGYKPGDEKPNILKVFPERVMTSSICEALDNTFVGQNMIELIGYPTQDIEFLSYLEMVQWNQRAEVVKFVKVGLTDENLNLLLCFIEKAEKISTLVVSNNSLTEVSLQILLNFSKQKPQLRTVYMGRNFISQQKAKPILAELKALGISIFV